MSPGIVAACCLLGLSAANGQSLVVDRGLPPDTASASPALRAGWEKPGQAFVADTFRFGATGEVWIIDHIRIWAVPDVPSGSARALGDLFSNIAIYGGIAVDPAEVACACYHVAKLKAASLQPGSNAATTGVDISAVGPDNSAGVWQVDFRDLRWSAPGGMNLQFGVLATGRAGADGHAPKWFTRAVPSGNSHRLESFDVAGKPLGPVELSHPVEFNVQVWAHPSENAGK